MKAIQVCFDEKLLARPDEDQEVKCRGRSAVIRKAVEQFLERQRRTRISQEYQRAYREEPELGEEYRDGRIKENGRPSEPGRDLALRSQTGR